MRFDTGRENVVLIALEVIVVSPHLDDAVFGCGELIGQFPGTVIVTAFAGIPTNRDVLTQWDAASGFSNAAQAIAVRREEDRSALAGLAAFPHWLAFCDSQYHATPTLETIVEALHPLVKHTIPAAILIPAGLFHSDHALVHEAMLRLRLLHPHNTWLMFEEPSYHLVPGLQQQRLTEPLKKNIEAPPSPWPLAKRSEKTRRYDAMRASCGR